jgi:hypothetical protein
MRIVALLALSVPFTLMCMQCCQAQTKAPITVQHYPAVPVIGKAPTDRLSSSLVAEVMPFVAPLVVETGDITNTLVLANASSEPAAATLTLFSVDGKIAQHYPIKLQPHEKKEYPLSSPEESEDTRTRWGSVMVEQNPKVMGIVIAGQVIVTDRRAAVPAYLDEELSMSEMEGSSKLSAVTDQTEGPPMMAITNLSPEPQLVSIKCIRDGKSPMASHIEIAAHATAVSKPCSNLALSTFAEYTSSIATANP